MNEDMILVDPYHHRKLYGEIVSAIREEFSSSALWIGKRRAQFSVFILLINKVIEEK